MFTALGNLNNDIANRVINDPTEYFNIVMGKQPDYATCEEMIDIWLLTGFHISKLFKRAIVGRR